MADKPMVDGDAIEIDYREMLATNTAPHFLEADIVRAFRETFETGHFDDRLPMSADDTVVFEMSLRFGRADIVIFHVDGSVTVIEVKDGARGYNHVVSGVGQAGLYATQIAMSGTGIRPVRRALLWTSTGDLVLDVLIEQVCEHARVVPLSWQSTKSIAAMRAAVEKNVGANRGRTQEG